MLLQQGDGTRLYPVHYSESDTSGEKSYEEFCTEDETVEWGRFRSLAVITGKTGGDKDRLADLLRHLSKAFAKDGATKNEIIQILEEYLPSFKHIEKGKSLDSKM